MTPERQKELDELRMLARLVGTAVDTSVSDEQLRERVCRAWSLFIRTSAFQNIDEV